MAHKFNNLSVEELRAHMPQEFDFTLVTLKGHLLTEAMLDDYIRSMLEKPDALLDKTRLQFDTKVKLAHALSGDLPPPILWVAIENLNRIRNSLAHRLTDANLHRLRAEFIRLVAQIGFQLDPGDDEDAAYVGSIGFLLGLLDALGGPRGVNHE
ncbi:hypothetical protein ACK1O1_04155 [Stenotrophomonas maltophilia]|uniref:hypothetical protein n=1 Tax=Stenotrophomonas maltophilia TaxID=40324 RepID=UPI003916F05C